jgi:hypothetical protein
MPLFLPFFSKPKRSCRPPKVNTKPHTETHPYKYLGSWVLRHTAGMRVGGLRACRCCRWRYRCGSIRCACLPAIDTDTPVAIRQGWPVFEDRSRFAGSSGGSSPMVCGLSTAAGRYGKGHELGVARGLWCAVCAGGYGFMRWGIMSVSSWPCSVVVV